MLSRQEVLGLVKEGAVRETLYLAVNVAGEALLKWAQGEGGGHLELFLSANEVVIQCLDELDCRVYVKTGKDKGQVEKNGRRKKETPLF